MAIDSPVTEKTACISDDGVYRLTLTRAWDRALRTCVMIGLNPSTADGRLDDPTIRRCVGFARGFGCGELVMVNLFALRSTDPGELYKAAEPVGPENDEALLHATRERDLKPLIVCGWGTHGDFRDRDRVVVKLLRDAGRQLYCLGMTKDGHPKHPLYLRADTELVPFRGRL